jgi:2-polyprenyl-3-methyl-5-hydroxy-6-metoxy-1,4-benzoquinol methylase
MERNVYIRQYNQNKNHWRFEVRKLILSTILKKYSNNKKIILDYGCGVGINLGMLSKFGKVFYYDKSRLALNYVRKKYSNKIFFININKLSIYKKKFDLIVATDVIEHIKNDKKEINKLAFLLFAFESFLINKIKFPFGISLLFFGKKIND